MNVKLLHQLPPSYDNPRNSEGAFLRGKRGEILFAYSRYHGESNHDHAACDIYLIASHDEGRTWSEPRPIVTAAVFGVKNVMSVSALVQKSGELAFYFLIKENDGSSTIGRAKTQNGVDYFAERCAWNAPARYYVINNDRLVRLRDGRIVAPAAYMSVEDAVAEARVPMVTTLLVSEDDGASFYKTEMDFTTADPINARYGLQEPGLIEREDELYLWMRTNYSCQYESVSKTGLNGFFSPRAGEFTSPPSPMQIKCYDGAEYAVYNPIPRYNGRVMAEGTWGRTPLVIRKSTDGGKTFGPLNVIEDDPDRGYSYPALFQTADGRLLVAYCRGDAADGNNLCRLGIAEIEMDSIE